jgi:methylmalonyl-CoA mutase N-terminal domain/subunit
MRAQPGGVRTGVDRTFAQSEIKHEVAENEATKNTEELQCVATGVNTYRSGEELALALIQAAGIGEEQNEGLAKGLLSVSTLSTHRSLLQNRDNNREHIGRNQSLSAVVLSASSLVRDHPIDTYHHYASEVECLLHECHQ